MCPQGRFFYSWAHSNTFRVGTMLWCLQVGLDVRDRDTSEKDLLQNEKVIKDLFSFGENLGYTPSSLTFGTVYLVVKTGRLTP